MMTDTDRNDEQTEAPYEDAPTAAAPPLPPSVSVVVCADRVLVARQTRPCNPKEQARELSRLRSELAAAGVTAPLVLLPYGIALEDHLAASLDWTRRE